MKEYLKGFFAGFKKGIDWLHIVAFNRKAPRGICSLIALFMLPLNLLVIILGSIIKGKNYANEIGEEMIEQLEEAE